MKHWEKEAGISFEKLLKVNGKTKVVADDGFEIVIFKSQISNLKSQISYPYPPSPDSAYFDYDKLKMPLIVRNFRPGDRMMPFGMRGHKKVKELFQEKKVERRRRGLIPIVVSGDEIIWVAGMKQAEHGKIGSTTRKILKIVMA